MKFRSNLFSLQKKCSVRFLGITIFSALGLLLFQVLPAQKINFQPWFASEIEVVDSLDPQIVTCTAYRVDGAVIYDSPQFLRLYPNQYYHLKFRFRLLNGLEEVNHLNYREKHFLLDIKPSDPAKFRINAISPKSDGVSVYGTSTGATGSLAAFEISLINPNGQVAGNGNFDLIIPTQELDLFYPNYMHEIPMEELMLENLPKKYRLQIEQFQLNSKIQMDKLKNVQLSGHN